MGLLDYYRQFSGMTGEEESTIFRARAEERRMKQLAVVDAVDLSGTHWHEFPHPDVVAAITYAARRGMNRPPDVHATELRQEIARRHGVEPERVVAGHGAAQLMQSALRTLLDPGDEVLMAWPSYAHLPAMTRRAGGRPVPVAGGHDPERLLSGLTDATRAVVVCNPNDPTGDWLSAEALAALARELPEPVWLLVDEALGDFADAEPPGASLGLLDVSPRAIVFRTLSKAYGLAGLRCGWALGPEDAAEDLAGVAPAGALATPVQAGALEALLECGPLVQSRGQVVAAEREHLFAELAGTGYDVHPSQANVLWIRLPGVRGAELAGRLERHAVRVAPGGQWGEDDHVRAQIQSPQASERLLEGLRRSAEPA
jgi:histidinol-phosphate aminotransferase